MWSVDIRRSGDRGASPRRPRVRPPWALGTVVLLMLQGVLAGCATMGAIGERYVACDYDTVWDTALDTLKDVPLEAQDKEDGRIETAWVETPVLGRPYGILQREGLGDKERVRTMLTLSRTNDMTIVRLDERREHFGFRGGARLYQWYQVEPSEEAMNALMTRLTTHLKERGCFVGV